MTHPWKVEYFKKQLRKAQQIPTADLCTETENRKVFSTLTIEQ